MNLSHGLLLLFFPRTKNSSLIASGGDPPEWSLRSVKLAVQITSGPRARETRTGFVKAHRGRRQGGGS